jgi:glycosyltransferase involved in cell wall biosynthesis
VRFIETQVCPKSEQVMTKRVLIVSSHYPPNVVGGAEIVAHRQAKLLQRAGWEICVIAGEILPSERIDDMAPQGEIFDGLQVYRLGYPHEHQGANFFDAKRERIFKRMLETYAPQVVHFHNMTGLGVNLIVAAKEFGAKVVVTLHDYWGFCFKNVLLRNDLSPCDDFDACHRCLRSAPMPLDQLPIRLRRDYVMTCLEQADAYVAPSRMLAANYRRAGLDGARIEVMSAGIDLDSIEPRRRQPPSTVRFLCSAHLGDHKGVRQLAEALRLLWGRQDLRNRWEIKIAGHGALRPFLSNAIMAAGMEASVKLLGHVKRAELLSHLDKSDVSILPSIWPENEPVSVLEAIASGAALIASRVGGVPDLIEHGVNGLLYEARDPDALAAAMAELIISPERITIFSGVNLDRRKRIDERATGEKLIALYERPEPPREFESIIVACGLNQPRNSTIDSIERAPATIGGRRLRFLWSRWGTPALLTKARRFWLWRLGHEPRRWGAAAPTLWRLGFARKFDARELAHDRSGPSEAQPGSQ